MAYGINSSGFVVGESQFEAHQPFRAFLWSPVTRRMRDLGTPGRFSQAFDINDQGVVVGQDDLSFPYKWTATGGTVHLPTLGGHGAARAINSHGSIVGWSLTLNGQTHAVLWPAGGGIVDLGTLGGWNSLAWDISDENVIVGSSEKTPLGAHHAFVARHPAPMTELIGGPGDAQGVNRCSRIVGSSPSPNADHATLWDKAC
ncbi:MAG: hypothetical protein ACT4P7_18430 [Gemmatimonadaceae bacterium]